MPENQKEITIASYNYLQEISAIPSRIRSEYISLLQKRKTFSSQKNIKLLKILYSYIDENRISGWDPKAVCKATGISMNALYIHKSRLLKGLREYFFDWQKIEKGITRKINKKNNVNKDSLKNSPKDIIEMKLQKALKMAEIGMCREAKNEFIKLEADVKTAFIDLSYKYLILTEIYEQIILYYFNRRNKYRLIYYLNKFNKEYESAKCLNLSLGEGQEALQNEALIEIRMNYCRFYLYFLNWYSNPNAKMEFNYPKEIYNLSKKFNYGFYLLKVLYHRAILEITSADFEKANDTCIEGYYTAKALKKKTGLHAFASLLYNLKAKTNVKLLNADNKHADNNHIVEYYRQIKKTAPLNLWILYLENSLVMSYYPEKRKEILEIFRSQADSNILLGDYSFAVYWKFILDSELYNNRLLSFFNPDITQKDYLEMRMPDEKLLSDMEKTCLNTLCYHKELNDIDFSWDIYDLYLAASYFREEGFDYSLCGRIINRMEHIKKTNKKTNGTGTFELLKLCIKMIENSYRRKYMLAKYEHKLKQTIDSFMKNPELLGIIDYAILSSLARRLKCKQVTSIIRELYGWIQTERPEIIKPILKEIEEREKKVHLIEGKEAAA